MDLPATSRRRVTLDLRLTPELVALIARKVKDAGPAPGVVVHNDDDYEASLQGLPTDSLSVGSIGRSMRLVVTGGAGAVRTAQRSRSSR
jgi:hypothetical protein